ncbi:hypothetical protein F442_22365 [Phytophthora nicotianae P10297]|uniref:Uncharacterized protein n=1 Tax=Phytophthora nicotianae P10297 TaxID=1317064 RepID=W2Y0S7_PHYNI|nr:hypothetical protein F442_22365 [Phytophthora nicotianae P10297]
MWEREKDMNRVSHWKVHVDDFKKYQREVKSMQPRACPKAITIFEKPSILWYIKDMYSFTFAITKEILAPFK